MIFGVSYHGTQAPAAEQSGDGDRPVLQVPVCESKLVIDGRLDEPRWNEAAATGPLKREQGRPAKSTTKAFMLRDAEHLYVGVTCELSGPASKKKEPAKKAVKNPQELFSNWWEKVACKKINKIEKDWIKENEPNDPDEDGGGDHWCVNEMMNNGDAHEMTAEIAERVFMTGYNKEKWELTMSDGLFCELDEIVKMAYEAGKKARG